MFLAHTRRIWTTRPSTWSSTAGDIIVSSSKSSRSPQFFASHNCTFSDFQRGNNNSRNDKGTTNPFPRNLSAFKIRRPQQEASPSQEPVLRNHMIDIFPGNYEDSARTGRETGSLANYDYDDEDDDEMDEIMETLHEADLVQQAKKERWLENSRPVIRVPVIDTYGRSYGRGARKKAHAKVWITPGFGNVTVNRKDLLEYFPRMSDRELLLDPFVVTSTCGKFDVQCQVRGGGLTGQAGAIRLGLSRALQHWNPEYRPPLKKMGFLTRDARKVEPKRVGRVKARKRPQWNRR